MASMASGMPMTPAAKIKRERSTDSDAAPPPSKKRQGSTIAFDSSMQPMHVRASGQKTRPEDLYTENDELVQSLQRQDVKDEDEDSGGNASDQDGESVYEDATGDVQEADAQEFDYLDQDGDEDDLFAKTFKKESPLADDDSDCEIISASKNTKLHSKHNVHTTDYDHHDTTEHASGCRTTHSATTPPPRSQDRKPKKTAQGPREADLVKDLRKCLVKQQLMHDKSKLYKPSIPMPSHRYWICVLKPGKKLSSINSEKHFIWMRGNRLTTVQTIWHTYNQTTCDAQFVLLHGFERVEFKDRCEELDYFNDKFICLRAVAMGHADAKGRELSEGIVAEIIELDE